MVVEEEGSTVTLVCSVKTVSSTTLTWRKDDTTDIPGVSSYSTDTSTLSSKILQVLTILKGKGRTGRGHEKGKNFEQEFHGGQ